jgi:hypothetical protein
VKQKQTPEETSEHTKTTTTMKLQLSTAILSSLTMTAVMAQCPVENCWCVPDDPTDAVCPPKGNRIDVDDTAEANPVIEFYKSLTPSDDGLFELYPPGCEPFPIVAAYFGKPICQGLVAESGNGGGSCAFEFSDDVCDGGTYDVYDEETYDYDRMLKKGKAKKAKKKKDDKKAKKEYNKASIGGLTTHEGSCGVCSSAQDYVALMNPNMKPEHEFCAREMTAALSDPALLPDLMPDFIECHKGMGFSDGCAELWASQWFAATLEAMTAFSDPTYTGPASCTRCAEVCFGSNFTDELCFTPFDETTCEQGPCSQCEAEVIQPTFARFAGRTRRSSGIVGVDTKYFCSETVDIAQPVVTCPAPAPMPVVPVPVPVSPSDDD